MPLSEAAKYTNPSIMAFPRRFSCDGAARPSATPSWCKRGYGRNERVARLGKAESTKPDLADNAFPIEAEQPVIGHLWSLVS